VVSGAVLWKLAVRFRSLFAVKVKPTALLTTAPPSVQFTKEYPTLGVAVSVTLDPQLTRPPPLAEPPFAGELLVVMVKVDLGAKLATKVRLPVAVKV